MPVGGCRRSAKSVWSAESETAEGRAGTPLNTLGSGFQWLIGDVNQAENGQGGVGQRGEDLGQARPPGVMAVLIPPAVLQEVEAVFHLPMPADIRLQVRRGDRTGVKTGDKIATFTGENVSRGRTHFTIDAQRDLASGDVQTFAQIRGIGKVDPKPPRFVASPLFSLMAWWGRIDGASAKQVFSASSKSG